MKKKQLTASEYRQKVSDWIRDGKRRGATHVIIAYDTARNNPFPVYVSTDTNIQQKIKSFNDNVFVQAIEVYNMNLDVNTQLLQARTWNI